MSEEIKDIIEAEKEYNASQIQVLETRGRPQAARHVHRLDKRFRPAPSGV